MAMPRLPFLLSMLAPLSCAAQALSEPWYFGGALGLTRVDNVYRCADPGAVSCSADNRASKDWIEGATLLGGGNLRLGRQRFYLDTTVRRNDYRQNDALDHLAYTLGTGWEWVLGNQLSGNLSVNARRALAPFNTGVLPGFNGKNIEQQKSGQFTLVYGLLGALRWDAGLYSQWRNFSVSSYAPYDYRIRSASTGLRWMPGADTTLRLGLRESRGLYPHAFGNPGAYEADSFRRRDLEGSIDWRASAHHSLKLNLASGKTRRFVQARYEDGTAGSLDWVWTPSPKLRASLGAARERGSDTRALGFATLELTDSRRVDSLRAQLNYQFSAKLFLDASAGELRRLLSRSLGSGAVDGEDRTKTYGLGLRWAFARQGQLGCDWGAERRLGQAGFSQPYSAHSLGCNFQWMLS